MNYTYPLYVMAVLNVIMAILVQSRAGRFKKTAYLFVASAVAVSIWAIGDALLLSLAGGAWLPFAKILFLVAPLWTMTFLLLFAMRFPDDKPISKARLRLIVSATLAFSLGVIYLSDRIIHTANMAGTNVISVDALLYSLYAFVFTIYFIAITAVFYRRFQHAAGLQQSQIGYVFAGAFLSSIFAFFTNLSLPLLGIGDFIGLGPLWTLIYIASYSFAIARYRLFDLRRAAIRAVTYILSLVTIFGAYFLVALFFRDYFLSGEIRQNSIDYFYVGMSIAAVIVFPFARRWFDRLTKHVFFRSDYNPQTVLDSLGDILLRSPHKQAIINKTSILFRDTFQSVEMYYLFDESKHTNAKKDLSSLVEQLQRVKEKNISIDDLEDELLYQVMHRHRLSLIVKLATSRSSIGWLAIGEKQSGVAYDNQDIRTIDIAADELAIAFENALNYEEIQQFNETLQTKVNDATYKLRRSNNRLKELDESKDDFISMASHQLRTPLTTVKGYLSMVLEGDMGKVDPRQQKVLEEAYNSSQRMAYLIADFLNVSRLQTGKFELETTETNLSTLISEEMGQLRASAQSRQLKLEYDAPSGPQVVVVDENKVRQVMMNLIDNAIYYSLAGTTIKIALTYSPTEAIFEVVDKGIGVPVDEQHKLFTKFYRATNAKRQRPDGTGIGLFMAKKIIVAHKGSIIFRSVEGKGSTFGFRLPLKTT